MNKKIVICAALTGASTPKEAAVDLPVTPDEIAADVVKVARAGASVVHIHARDHRGEMTLDVDTFGEIYEKSKKGLKDAGLDAIFNFSTAALYPTGDYGNHDERLDLMRALKPEMCTFNSGSINWAFTHVYMNPPEFLDKLVWLVNELDIKPEFEIFDTAMINNVRRYIDNGEIKPPYHFQFVLGLSHGLKADLKTLVYLIDSLPEGATWTVAGIGKAHLSMLLAALAAGADGIRVGMEDNIWLYKGVPGSNEAQVKRAVELVALAGREAATAREAREILGVKNRD
ncbi:MAG: 3-keto-5-aminohexanoate cleavage protein [Oscillospiraceae bacterium]|nr:3-keto-5-aminohexanoate cleavage protein [Oscillospiraceae bacterium]